jgi:DNA (cytosine-5)-methyltransferase 1
VPQPLVGAGCPCVRGVSAVILDLFAGPGGWDEGLRSLDVAEPVVGIEWDAAACATRAAAGHLTIRADVAQYPTEPFAGRVSGLIASPPCQDFSMAGKRAGLSGARGQLIHEVLRWADALEPEWVACEQVPPALPVWELFANQLRAWGYRTWAGVLNAADYGVPQTRKRAFLMATKGELVLPEPTHAQHPEGGGLFGGVRLPWVTMAEALGWGYGEIVNTRGDRQTPGGNEFSTDRPSWALTSKAGSWAVRNGNFTARDHRGQRGVPYERSIDEPAPTVTGGGNLVLHTNRDQREDGTRQTVEGDRPAPSMTGKSGGQWVFERPSTTVCADPRVSPPGFRGRADDYGPDGEYRGERSMDNAIRLTVQQAAVLQGFPADYPWQGTKTKQFEQCGNAVPPPLAAAVVAPLLASSRRAAA